MILYLTKLVRDIAQFGVVLGSCNHEVCISMMSRRRSSMFITARHSTMRMCCFMQNQETTQ
jgi:hypothetical protein